MRSILWLIGWVSGAMTALTIQTISDPSQKLAFVIVMATVSTLVFNNALRDYVLEEFKKITWTITTIIENEESSDSK